MGNRVLLLLAGVALAAVLVVALRTQSDSEVPDTPSPDPVRPAEEVPLDPEDLFVDDPETPEPEAGPAPEGAAILVVTVVDESGAAFPDARVLAAVRGPMIKVSGVTGADGTCRLEGLPTNLDVAVTASAGATFSATTRRLKLTEEKETEVRLVLTEGGAVEGRVVDETGTPVAGTFAVTVSPGAPNLPPGTRVRRGKRGRSYTGSSVDGDFVVRGVPPGKFTAKCRPPGFEAGASDPFEVFRGETTSGILITVSRGGSVTGVVVSRKTGEPVPGVSVSLGPRGARGAMSGMRDLLITSGAGVSIGGMSSSKSDDQGRFRLTGLKPGAYSLRAIAKDHAPTTVEEVVVEKDRETGGILVSLGEGGSITGTVFGPAGTPVPGAEVSYSKQDSRIRITGAFGPKVQADKNGVYTINHLEPGDYFVRRTQGGRGGASSVSISVVGLSNSVPAEERDPDAVTVIEGQITRFDIRSDARCAIRGTLLDAAGKPVRKMVQLRKTEQMRNNRSSPARINIPRTTFPNGKGEFSFESLDPGEYVVTVEGLTERVNVSGGETRTVEFRLDSATIEGVVRNDRGEPAKGARVNLQRQSDNPRASRFDFNFSTGASTDEQGLFRIEGVQPGTYKVTATQAGSAGESRQFPVASGETVTGIEVVLESPVEVRVEVLDSGGTPRSGMAVTLFRAGDRPHGSTTGEDGTAAFKLTPGRYRVHVRTGTTAVAFTPSEIVVGRGGSQAFTVRPR